MQTPSAKVITATVVALLATVVAALAADTSVLEPLPDWVEGIAVAVLVAVAGYLKKETNPAQSTFEH